MNGRHGSHRNATSPRRSGCSWSATPRRDVAAHTTRTRHLNLIPGCVWSLASPAAYIAAVASARTHTRMCTCVLVCAAVKVHSRTRYHKRGEWRPSSFPTERERGPDLSTGDILQRGGARVHVHAHPARGTRKSIPRHEVGYSDKTIKGVVCLYVTL